MRNKATIIGAGTAGLIAAKHLAVLGIDVTVYDQKSILGVPVAASGIVSINGLRSLGVDYNKAVTNTLYGANIHAGKETMHISSRKPMAYVLDRQALNRICCDESEAEGAKVITARRISGGDLDKLHRDSVIIGADGAISTVAKHFGMGTVRDCILTYKAEYGMDIEGSKAAEVELFFNNKITPGFFAWLCPRGKGIMEVGAGISSARSNSKAAFEKFIATKYLRSVMGSARFLDSRASMIPLRIAGRIADNEKEVLLIGDAAGQVKPTTGGGIVMGGNSAMIAARVVADHINKDVELDAYETMFRRRYGFDIALHNFIRGIYTGFSTGGFETLLRFFNSVGMDSFLSRYGDMDSPSKILKRFFLRGLLKD